MPLLKLKMVLPAIYIFFAMSDEIDVLTIDYVPPIVWKIYFKACPIAGITLDTFDINV